MGACGSAASPGSNYRIEPDVGRPVRVDWVARFGVDGIGGSSASGESSKPPRRASKSSKAQQAHLKRANSPSKPSYDAMQFKCIVGRGAMGTVQLIPLYHVPLEAPAHEHAFGTAGQPVLDAGPVL